MCIGIELYEMQYGRDLATNAIAIAAIVFRGGAVSCGDAPQRPYGAAHGAIAALLTTIDNEVECCSYFNTGFILDPAKCGELNLQDKQRLVHEIARVSKDAPNMLQSFTRRELLEIICAELGKERKYTGYNKSQMIEHLLKIISKKSNLHIIQNTPTNSPANSCIGSKRKRGPPSHDLHHAPLGSSKEETVKITLCQNVACRATLNPEDSFCKRCSCCICHCYDDNKDPSLWLTCSSDLPNEESCGMSCHLQCALNNQISGILKGSCGIKLDGSFYCVSCGKINELMRTWRKQLLVAKEARRVDILSLRIFLAHKILVGTEVYKEVQKIVESALKLLENEVGPLDHVYARMTRGIVSRLSCGAEVQKLCSTAVECFDSKFSDLFSNCVEKKDAATCSIRFEECLPTSVVIVLEYKDKLLKNFLGCRLWHRISTTDYPEQPTFIVLRPEKRFKLENLHPSTEYFCKASLFSSTGILGAAEAKWVTPYEPTISPSKDQIKITTENHQVESLNSDIKLSSGDHPAKDLFLNIRGRFEEFLTKPPSVELFSYRNFAAVSPSTPSKPNEMRQFTGLSSRKQLQENDYEYSVRVVKWLEHQGHIDEIFRVKFLTWFSLKATQQERRVVSAFVDALIDDPASLADQLIHTFTDEIYCEQKP
ncbi:VIN3-like protein 1 [Gastrolobium bilobum]|uniref:VIN3-like protein 1 n=1 Tax=Gastrolobium bilobum TaxID=150636 RepID=UPI002AB0E2B1|nr:VIN3-like protein 1 [Gastrolobium bilobum]